MRSPEMRKKRRLRSVCAPQRRSAGTSIGPKLSFSMRVPAIPALMLRVNCGQVEEQDLGALARRELVTSALRAVEETGVSARVLVDAHGTFAAVGRGDKAQPAPLVFGGEVLPFILRRDAAHLRLDPDLQEVRAAVLVVVGLAVLHTAAGAH